MNILHLSFDDLERLSEIFTQSQCNRHGLNNFLGKKVIVRTYSAGVWFGTLAEKSGDEVIIEDARRMWRWWAEKSISLSAVSRYGIKPDKSKITPSVESVWLTAIELIPCTKKSIDSIEGADDAEAE